MRMNRSLLVFLFIFGQVNLFSQSADSIKNISVSLKYSKGFIYPHHESFKYFIKDYTSAFDFNVSKKVSGEKVWHQLYRNPTVGFGYSHVGFGNPEQLGNANALYSFISISILENQRFRLSSKFAGGVAWLSKRFDLYDNKYNIAIGSNLNAYLNVNLDFDLSLTKRVYLLMGVGLTHFSNGGMQQPNKGFNLFTIQTGVKYKLNDNQELKQSEPIPKYKKKNELTFIYSGGAKTLEPARLRKYFVSSFSLNAERQFTYKSRAGIGIDLFKDNSRKEYLLEEDIVNPKGKDLFYAGGHVSYDLVFGKTSFTIQMGAYFWQHSKHFESVYHRIGLKYRFAEHWMANMTLKTFWAAADFAEWGIGYRF